MAELSLCDLNGKVVLSLGNHLLRYPYHAKLHTHRRLELSLVKEGSGFYEVEERRYAFSSGDIFLLNNREAHRIVLPEQPGQMTNMVVHFEPEFLWSLSGNAIDYRHLDVFFSRGTGFSHKLDKDDPATDAVRQRMLEMERELETGGAYYDLKIRMLLEDIMLQILRGFRYFLIDSTRRQVPIGENYRINEVLNYIETNIGRDLTLKGLAKIACVSPAYFSSLFKRLNGITLFDYITRKRVEHSILLILTTSASLTEISTLCGFNNSTSFNKAFRRVSGYAPSHIRKKLSQMDDKAKQQLASDLLHDKTVDLPEG